MRRAPGRWPDTSCPAPQLPGHRDVVLDRSKRWAGRFLARPTRRRMLLRNMAVTCRANDPSRKNAVSVYMRRRGGPAGLRPAPQRPSGQGNSNSNGWFPAGWRGGSGCGGRCKYVHVSSVAPSMALTPPQPDPPHLRQIPAVGRCRPWSTRGSMPCMDEIQSMISKSVGTSIHALRGSNSSKSNISVVHRTASTRGVDLRVDQGRHPPGFRQIAENCRRRGGSGCGGVRGMDAAAKPPGTGLRRPPQPGTPRHPTECSCCRCCCRRRRRCSGLCGCRAQPGRSPPLMLRRRMHWAKFPCST